VDGKNRAVVIALLMASLAVPVLATGGNPVALPVPLPAMPADIQPLTTFPSVVLPSINHATWPSAIDAIDTVRATLLNTVNAAESTMQAEFGGVSARIAAVRSPIGQMKALIGAPQTDITAQSDTAQYNSLYSMASASTAAMQTSVAYLRGLSGIGTTGLNLTFIFIGLGWLLIVNLLDLLLSVTWSLVRFIVNALDWTIKVVDLVLQILQAVGGFIPGT